MIAKVQFSCPRCSTPGELDIPRAEILVGGIYLTVIWPVTHTTCGGCQKDMSLVLGGISLGGIQWGIRETPPQVQPSRIVIPFPEVPPFKPMKG